MSMLTSLAVVETSAWSPRCWVQALTRPRASGQDGQNSGFCIATLTTSSAFEPQNRVLYRR